MSIRIALIGYGKIARDAHHPTLDANPDFELVATVARSFDADRQAQPARFTSLDALLDSGMALDAVALCVPPQHRFELACRAVDAGLHVLLEKPPGMTLSEVSHLEQRAASAGITLYASWHSRHAPGVEAAREWLSTQNVTAVRIDWCEDVTVFHPGQAWIWEPGGLGVFDPGINALSIATHILARPFALGAATLEVPSNCATPIAADLSFTDSAGAPIRAVMDWRHEGDPVWQIVVETETGELRLEEGGARMRIDGEIRIDEEKDEYGGVYALFSTLIKERRSDTDVRPFTHVADAFMLGERRIVDAFHE
ncbi:Gfo/Idh/MocA family protein [Salinisphaera sp. LB1]|uniref:Gfo/Idh/MocA family protein n=1 Tax=Salinisphaera sp. LB1 TaxID=2183911 RepID=UPI000D7067CA|nr:Gfo/Idh/MocA family oxidoreductase [Salinisphaera sp. LB1]AWN16768.1 D-galactose 1-dehydrogenase [Salinisphaera sp. LB1]